MNRVPRARRYEILYHNPLTGKKVAENQRDTQWDTWTAVLGFPVMGIWPDGSDGTDVNAVCATRDGRYLVTAGDDGLVKLFNAPCVVEDAPHRAYRGHCSHVMCVRVNYSDQRVCSVGGKDRAVFQFKLVPLASEPEPEPEPEKVWGPLDSEGRSFGWIDPRDMPRKPAPADAAPARPPPGSDGPAAPEAGAPAPAGVRDSVISEVDTIATMDESLAEDHSSDDDPYEAGGWGGPGSAMPPREFAAP